MKIRTDFVTNSSSSSFMVSITFVNKDGKEFVKNYNTDYDDGGWVNLNCKVRDITKLNDISSISEKLDEAIVSGPGCDGEQRDDDEYDEEYEDEYGDEDGGLRIDFELNEGDGYEECDYFEADDVFSSMFPDIESIDKIVLKRQWDAYGEGSCLPFANLDNDAKLRVLAKQYLDASGSDKEKAKKEFSDYLTNYDEEIDVMGSSFPTGFMGSKVKCELVWNNVADDLEEFAKIVINNDFKAIDEGIETTTIDMNTRKASHKAQYIFKNE